MFVLTVLQPRKNWYWGLFMFIWGTNRMGVFLYLTNIFCSSKSLGKLKKDLYKEKFCDCFFPRASPGALTITKARIPGGKQSARIWHEKYNTCISFKKDERNYALSTRPNLRYLAELIVRLPLSYLIDSPDEINC